MPVFRGSAVAIVTPFNQSHEIDFSALQSLLEWQIVSGTDAIVVAGTTGECATLSQSEFEELVDFAVQTVAGRVPVLAGTGRNSTAQSLILSQRAQRLGADGLLMVNPYYNKSTQAGLIAHFTAVADAVEIPILLYNVPSRTGMSFTAATYAVLAQHPNITGVKEASGDMSLLLETLHRCPADFAVYSGNDDSILPVLALGGQGVISTLANIAPADTHRICQAFFDGDMQTARQLQVHYAPLIGALFCETNPIPVKMALALMGRCGGDLRLPLVPISKVGEQRLTAALRQMQIL